MQLTQKETSLLKDLKEQEQLCVEKYTKHEQAAQDPQLKQLFRNIAATERHHLDMINQIESGQSPAISSGDCKGGCKTTPTFSACYTSGDTPQKKQDAFLCADLLATEKHVSHLYDTCVFEFGQPELRQVLNQIQSDEQHHGEQLWQYMKTNNMYA